MTSLKHFFSGLFLVTGLLAGQAGAATYFPTDTWRTSTPEAQGIDSFGLLTLLQDIEDRNLPIYSVLIVRNGHLVLETYRHPYHRESPLEIYSCTKSILSALTGIAIGEGRIKDVNQSVLPYFADRQIANRDARKEQLRIEDLLTMTSGLEWNNNQDFMRMIQSRDWIGYILDKPMSSAPGEKFNYAETGPHLLSAILRKTTGETAASYGESRLFGPTGMHAKWISDPSGTSIGGFGLITTPLDLMRFGYLYLQEGRWNGKQVVPAEWVRTSTHHHADTLRAERPGYGYFWWLPEFGGFTAIGSGGHYIYVNPEKQLVAVITAGVDSADNLPLIKQHIMKAVRQDSPLPARPVLQAALSRFAADMEEPAPHLLPQSPLAAKVSGKVFQLVDESNGREETFSICFREDPAEAVINCDGTRPGTTVGLDGRYRQSNRVFSRGRWVSPDEFQIEQIQRDNTHNVVRLRFSDGQLTQTVIGTASHRERRSVSRRE